MKSKLWSGRKARMSKVAAFAVAVCVGIAGAGFTARTPFADVNTEVPSNTEGDSTVVLQEPEGPTAISVEPRDGWAIDGAVPPVHIPGETDVIHFVSEDGEGHKDLHIVDDWRHLNVITNSDEHITAPGLVCEDPPPNQLKLYVDPQPGAVLSVPAVEWVAVTGRHEVTVSPLPCPVPGCDQSHLPKPETNVVDVVPVPGPNEIKCATAVEINGVKYLKEGTHSVFVSTVSESECDQCCCTGTVKIVIDVCKASLRCPEYIGLDLTTDGKRTNIVKEASVSISPSGDPTCDWTLAGTAVFVNGTKSAKGNPVEIRAKTPVTASEAYRGEHLASHVTIKNASGEADTTVTNDFTVVKVDVEIDDIAEEQKEKNRDREEEVGAYLYHIPDAPNGEWTEEGTNNLKSVKFKWEPEDLPQTQGITISVREKCLYVKTKDGRYEEAKNAYSFRELETTQFFLHGHSPSTEYLGDAIEIRHPSSGAKDVAKFTVFGRPWLVPDYDRDGKIDDADEAKAKDGKTIFRFWINDDDDKGDLGDWEDQIPGSGGNCNDLKVNGLSDLGDFTPIWLDVEDLLPKGCPFSLDDTIIMLDSDCVKAAVSDFTVATAGSFHINREAHCGNKFDVRPEDAPVMNLSGGRLLPDEFKKILNKDQGVLLVEGVNAGGKFSVVIKVANRILAQGELVLKISSVNDMYRWLNIRYATGPTSGSITSTVSEEPVNRPDKECESTHIITVHGYNVNVGDAKSWASEIFKRLWQSGSDAMFTAVDWMGNQGQMGSVTPNYYVNVLNAFGSIDELKKRCDALPGKKHVFMAHSLGNMLVSSAIQDREMMCNKYFLMNAAVARQAYDETLADEEEMIDEDWEFVMKTKPNLSSPHWHSLFAGNDVRKKLSWAGRFGSVTKVAVNCFATTENVTGAGFFNVWWQQEIRKGKGVGQLKFGEAGWGIRTKYLGLNYYGPFHGLYASALEEMTRDLAITDSVFEPFNRNAERMHSVIPYEIKLGQNETSPNKEEEYEVAYHLAYGIPATTGPAGSGPIDGADKIDYLACRTDPEQWPRGGDVWGHSDVILVAYSHIRKLFDTIVEKSK